jgi:hypothetical protein
MSLTETARKKTEFIENIDYYYENGLMVLTELYHLNRGYCCGNGCRHCPFDEENLFKTQSSTLKSK